MFFLSSSKAVLCQDCTDLDSSAQLFISYTLQLKCSKLMLLKNIRNINFGVVTVTPFNTWLPHTSYNICFYITLCCALFFILSCLVLMKAYRKKVLQYRDTELSKNGPLQHVLHTCACLSTWPGHRSIVWSWESHSFVLAGL